MNIYERMPWVAQNSVFAKLAEIAEVDALPREERMKYDYALKKFRDTIAVMEYATKEGQEKGLEQGLKQGREQGREEGREEARLEMARKLKENGVSPEIIATTTGMTTEQVEKL